MSKCLVTRLKATVNNPNLPKLGTFTFVIHSNGEYKKLLSLKGVISSEANGGLFYNKEGNSFTEIGNKLEGDFTIYNNIYVMGSSDVTIVVTDNYKLFSIDLRVSSDFDISQLWYRNSLENVIIYNTQNAYGNADKIMEILSKNNCQAFSLGGNPKITGNIENLTTNATSLYIENCGISGSLENYLKNVILKKRISFSINPVAIHNSNVTWHEQVNEMGLLNATKQSEDVYQIEYLNKTATYTISTDTWSYSD